MKEEAFKFQNMKTEAKQTDFTSTCKSKFDKKSTITWWKMVFTQLHKCI